MRNYRRSWGSEQSWWIVCFAALNHKISLKKLQRGPSYDERAEQVIWMRAERECRSRTVVVGVVGGVWNRPSTTRACASVIGRVLDGQEALGRQFTVVAMTFHDDVSDLCVSGSGDDGLDEDVDVWVACRRRDAILGVSDGSTVVGNPSLPQQQHAVRDVGRRLTGGQCVERHAGNGAAGNVQLHGQLDSGAGNVACQTLEASSRQDARLSQHCNANRHDYQSWWWSHKIRP